MNAEKGLKYTNIKILLNKTIFAKSFVEIKNKKLTNFNIKWPIICFGNFSQFRNRMSIIWCEGAINMGLKLKAIRK